MRLVMFCANHPPRLGAVLDDVVVDLNFAHQTFLRATGDDCESQELMNALVPRDSLSFLRGGRRAEEAAKVAFQWVISEVQSGMAPRTEWGEPVTRPLKAVTLKPPILHPRKIICVGLNYRDHADEQRARIPKNPILFAKFDRSLVGHGADVLRPRTTKQLDYEAELAVVIGRSGRFIAVEDAPQYIAGYSAFNDITARDVQLADRQWLRGKMGESHAPFGPWLVTADEVADPGSLGIRLSVNGDVLQDSNTKQMIFDVRTLVSFISQTVTLEPGDVIATGTPGGVGFVHNPPVFLAPGDVVRMEIDEIGVLENRIASED